MEESGYELPRVVEESDKAHGLAHWSLGPLVRWWFGEAHCYHIIEGPETCRAARKHPKKSLHVKVHIEGQDILALVDTGATSSFVQASAVKKLGLWEQVRPCN